MLRCVRWVKFLSGVWLIPPDPPGSAGICGSQHHFAEAGKVARVLTWGYLDFRV